jgi:hypothetical protein
VIAAVSALVLTLSGVRETAFVPGTGQSWGLAGARPARRARNHTDCAIC